MLKVAHISSHFNIGGAQTMLSDILNVQVNSCDVTLFVLTDDINEALIGRLDRRIKVIRLHRNVGSKNKWAYIRLNMMINFSGYDLIHIHEITIWNQLYIAPWVRKFQTVHNTGKFSKNFNRCEIVFAISRSVYDGLLAQGYKNVILAANGIDTSIIKRKMSFYSNDTMPFRIVQVSRLIVSHKGQDLIVEAMKLLKDTGRLPSNMTLDFVGNGQDEMMLREMVLRYGLMNQIHFCGVRDRDWVYEHLCDYDLFLQPSRYEGFGLTVAESVSACVPVLVSQNEGPLEIINDGVFGETFENGNVEDLANKIIDVYTHYKQNVVKVKEGCDYVHQNYDVKRTAKKYLLHYENK